MVTKVYLNRFEPKPHYANRLRSEVLNLTALGNVRGYAHIVNIL